MGCTALMPAPFETDGGAGGKAPSDADSRQEFRRGGSAWGRDFPDGSVVPRGGLRVLLKYLLIKRLICRAFSMGGTPFSVSDGPATQTPARPGTPRSPYRPGARATTAPLLSCAERRLDNRDRTSGPDADIGRTGPPAVRARRACPGMTASVHHAATACSSAPPRRGPARQGFCPPIPRHYRMMLVAPARAAENQQERTPCQFHRAPVGSPGGVLSI